MTDGSRTAPRRLEWVWAGALLVISAVLPFAGPRGPELPGMSWVADGAFAAAMLVFAFGRDSVVARRPLGVTALVTLAGCTVASLLLGLALTSATGLEEIPAWWNPVSSALLVLSPAAGLVAAVQVARAGVVPRALRWTPLIAFAVLVVPAVLVQLIVTALGAAALVFALVMWAILDLTHFVAIAGLGAVAIVAGLRPQQPADAPAIESAVQVYPPAVPSEGTAGE